MICREYIALCRKCNLALNQIVSALYWYTFTTGGLTKPLRLHSKHRQTSPASLVLYENIWYGWMWVFLFEPSSLFCLSSCAAPAVVGGQLQDSQSRLEIFCRRLHLHSPGYYLAGYNWIKLWNILSWSDSSEYICRQRPLLSHFWPPFVPVHKSFCNLNMAGKS